MTKTEFDAAMQSCFGSEPYRESFLDTLKSHGLRIVPADPVAWIPSEPTLPFGLDWSYCRTGRTEYFNRAAYADPEDSK